MRKSREIIRILGLLLVLVVWWAASGLPEEAVPEIREKLEMPITLEFRDVGLDYIMDFLTDATGVNIIASSDVHPKERKVTIRIKDMSLRNALNYILKGQGLSYRIEKNAIWVATPEEMEREEPETRIYSLQRGAGLFAEFGEVGGEGIELGAAAQVSKIKTIKDTLEESVSWSKGSKLVLDGRTGVLIITNTPSNLQTIENILYKLDITPIQILIEARFMEVEVTDLGELGIEWGLRSNAEDEGWMIERKGDRGRTEIKKGSGVYFTDFPAATKDLGFNLTYQGVLWHPQFDFVIHALEQTGKTKTLSCPRIIALNNQTATIKVVTEQIYSTSYELGVVWEDKDGDGERDPDELSIENVPTGFITREVGKLLRVTPSVGQDMKTITLTLVPEVSELSEDTYTYGTVTMPKFKSRSISTTVVIEDGQTVVLGGLITETDTKTTTKVPLLGDIPLLGRLFRKDSNDVTSRNLLIFVTASIVLPTGEIASR